MLIVNWKLARVARKLQVPRVLAPRKESASISPKVAPSLLQVSLQLPHGSSAASYFPAFSHLNVLKVYLPVQELTQFFGVFCPLPRCIYDTNQEYPLRHLIVPGIIIMSHEHIILYDHTPWLADFDKIVTNTQIRLIYRITPDGVAHFHHAACVLHDRAVHDGDERRHQERRAQRRCGVCCVQGPYADLMKREQVVGKKHRSAFGVLVGAMVMVVSFSTSVSLLRLICCARTRVYFG